MFIARLQVVVKRLYGLDGLRGVAALAVVAYHYFDSLAYYGLLGVELFFIISGFVILMTLERVKTVGEFALHRFARLYPAYWLSVVVAGCFLLLTHQASIGQAALNATMLQGFFGHSDLVDPYWTLAFELWFYVLMAILFAFNQLKNLECLALIWLAVMFAFRAVMIFGRGTGLYWNWQFHLLAMPQFGHLFIAGMMIYRARSHGWSRSTAAVLLLAIIYSAFGRPDWAAVSSPVYFVVNAIFICAVVSASAQGGFFDAPLLVWFGQRSYSIYLLFEPARLIAIYVLGDDLAGVATGLALTMIAASLSWTFIERPAQVWARGP